MTDKLDAILTELEALRESYENAPATGPSGLSDLMLRRANFASRLIDFWPFLFAKLQATMEMAEHYGKHLLGCPLSDDAIRYDYTSAREGCTCGKDAALAAWQQVGEEEDND